MTNKALKNYRSTAIIYVVIAIVVIVGGLVFLNSRGTNTNLTSDNQNPQSSNITGFSKVDSNAYAFYYPENYVDSQQLKSSGVLAGYENPKKSGGDPEVIFIKMQEGSNTNLETPTFQFCTNLAEKLREKQDDKITAEVTGGGQLATGGGKGCKIRVESKIAQLGDTLIMVQKLLWNPNAASGNMYIASTSYFKTASKDEAQKLDTAIDHFLLK